MHAYIYPPDLQFPHTGVLQLLLYYVVYGRITPTHAMHVPHCRPLLDRSSRSFPGRTVCVLTQDNVLVLGLLFFYFLFGWLTGQPSRCQSTSSPKKSTMSNILKWREYLRTDVCMHTHTYMHAWCVCINLCLSVAVKGRKKERCQLADPTQKHIVVRVFCTPKQKQIEAFNSGPTDHTTLLLATAIDQLWSVPRAHGSRSMRHTHDMMRGAHTGISCA